jgi:hypothetical protein
MPRDQLVATLQRYEENTGWKPMVRYGVAWPLRYTGLPGWWRREIARRSGEQCSMGFQPVFSSHDRPMFSKLGWDLGKAFTLTLSSLSTKPD